MEPVRFARGVSLGMVIVESSFANRKITLRPRKQVPIPVLTILNRPN